MDQQHSSSNTKQRAYVSPQQSKPEIQHKEVENEEGGHSSTHVKRVRTSANHFDDTPTKRPEEVENEKGDHSSTPVKKERDSINYHTPTKRHAHPPGWDTITWAPKILC
uniref:Uncharacterized protein n=1 Tax=Panagrolaimus davidi TaxID=227884 RepID=A0A914R318_9BILA